MNCLIINLDRGAGVELIGNMFTDILSRFDIFKKIDIWKMQCVNTSKNYKLSEYDIVFINDPEERCMTTNNLLNKLNKDAKIFGISHGTLLDIPKNYSAVFELNFPYVCELYKNKNDIFRVFPINFSPGNIWIRKEDLTLKTPPRAFMFSGRVCRTKLPKESLEILKKENIELDVYGKIIDEEYFNEIESYINYQGNYSHTELIDIYNNYDYLFVSSNTECLSLSIREAILCGVIPIVIDNEGYSNPVSNYIKRYPSLSLFIDSVRNGTVFDKPNSSRDVFEKEFNFDKMILDILIYLRGYFGKEIKFNKDKICNNINYLNDYTPRNNLTYTDDVIDWNNVNL